MEGSATDSYRVAGNHPGLSPDRLDHHKVQDNLGYRDFWKKGKINLYTIHKKRKNSMVLLGTIGERIEIIDNHSIWILGRFIELLHIVLIVAPNTLYYALVGVGLLLSFGAQGRETNLVETVVSVFGDVLDLLLQIEHRLQKGVVEHGAINHDPVRSVVPDL